MAEQKQFRLRVLYGKQGRLVMLSHLEVADALRRCVRRANLPFAVSQGFSPHMKMTFSAALPVGVGSNSEIFDLMLTEYVPEAEAFQRLKDACVPDLMVLNCKYVDNKAKAASVAFPVGHYLACFDGDASSLVFPTEITVCRAGKKPKTQVVADYLRGDVAVQGPVMTFALEALANGSLRPDNLLKASLEAYNAQVVRIAQVDDDARAANSIQFETLHEKPLKLVSCTRIDQRDSEGNSLVESMR